MPAAPVEPCGPVRPRAPMMPCTPSGPAGPMGPWMPCGPPAGPGRTGDTCGACDPRIAGAAGIACHTLCARCARNARPSRGAVASGGSLGTRGPRVPRVVRGTSLRGQVGGFCAQRASRGAMLPVKITRSHGVSGSAGHDVPPRAAGTTTAKMPTVKISAVGRTAAVAQEFPGVGNQHRDPLLVRHRHPRMIPPANLLQPTLLRAGTCCALCPTRAWCSSPLFLAPDQSLAILREPG